MNWKSAFILLSLSAAIFIAPFVKAQEEENIPFDPRQIRDPLEIKEKIKERLEKTTQDSDIDLKEADLQEATQAAKETIKYYAWVGTLKKIDKKTLYINTLDGEKEAEVMDKATIIQNEKGKPAKEVKVEDLKEGNFIIAMGELKNEKIISQRIISSPFEEPKNEKRVVFGKVSEIEEDKIIITNGEKNILPIDEEKISLTIKNVKKPKLVDIQIEDRLYAIVMIDKSEKITATLAIYVIPGKYSPDNQENKLESPAATFSAQPLAPSKPETPINKEE